MPAILRWVPSCVMGINLGAQEDVGARVTVLVQKDHFELASFHVIQFSTIGVQRLYHLLAVRRGACRPLFCDNAGFLRTLLSFVKTETRAGKLPREIGFDYLWVPRLKISAEVLEPTADTAAHLKDESLILHEPIADTPYGCHDN